MAITRKQAMQSSVPFEVPLGPFSFGEYVVTPLSTTGEIVMEGAAMRHCVAGYANSAKTYRYLILSVTKDGQRSSTIGMNVVATICPDMIFLTPQQHYKAYNQPVTCETEKQIPDYIRHAVGYIKPYGSRGNACE